MLDITGQCLDSGLAHVRSCARRILKKAGTPEERMAAQDLFFILRAYRTACAIADILDVVKHRARHGLPRTELIAGQPGSAGKSA